MDVFISGNQLLKFYQVAQRVRAARSNDVQKIIISSDLQSMGTTLPEHKAALMAKAQKHALELYGVSDHIYDADELLSGARAMDFFQFVLIDSPKSTLLDAAKQLKRVTVQDQNKEINEHEDQQVEKSSKKKSNELKVIEHAGMSFLPGFVVGLSKCLQLTDVFTDFNISNPELNVKHHFEVKPLKQNPKSVVEEAAAFLLVSDTFEEVKKKLNKGFCEDGNVEFNPLLDHCRVALCFVEDLQIGEKTYQNVEDVQNDFKEKRISPQQLKQGVIQAFERFWKTDAESKDLQQQLSAKK